MELNEIKSSRFNICSMYDGITTTWVFMWLPAPSHVSGNHAPTKSWYMEQVRFQMFYPQNVRDDSFLSLEIEFRIQNLELVYCIMKCFTHFHTLCMNIECID